MSAGGWSQACFAASSQEFFRREGDLPAFLSTPGWGDDPEMGAIFWADFRPIERVGLRGVVNGQGNAALDGFSVTESGDESRDSKILLGCPTKSYQRGIF